MTAPDPVATFQAAEALLGSRFKLERLVAANRERVLFAAVDQILKRRVSLRLNFYSDEPTRAWFATSFPEPTRSGYESRRHPWVGLPDSIEREAPELWDPVRPLYEAGRYAEAADLGRGLIEAHPDQGFLYYNTACCESLAGRPERAVELLRRVIEMWEGARDMAKQDSDFDPIRDEPAFRKLTGA